jgi:hypothetical protein
VKRRGKLPKRKMERTREDPRDKGEPSLPSIQ